MRRVNRHFQGSTLADNPPPNGVFFGRVWRRLLPLFAVLRTPPQQTTSPRSPSSRGVQRPNISSDLAIQPAHRTEIGIITPGELVVFVKGLKRDSTSTTESTSEESYLGSEGSGCSEGPTVNDGTYHHFDKDYRALKIHLKDRGFSEVSRMNPNQNLEEQVECFLTAPKPSAISGNLIRFIIFTGHNSYDHQALVLRGSDDIRYTYSWNQLPKAINDVPQHVLVVVILACCSAEAAVNTIENGLKNEKLPELVIASSSGREESSYASNFGDHTLGALIGALEVRDPHQSYNNWPSFEHLLKEKLKTERDVHGAKWGEGHPQNPFIRVYNVDQLVS